MQKHIVAAFVIALLASFPARAEDDAAQAPVKQSYMVFFDFTEQNLTDMAAQVAQAAAVTYASDGGVRVDLIGHTDTAEADPKMWRADAPACKKIPAKERRLELVCVWRKPNPEKLGLLRAKAVADQLVAHGVPRDAIHVRSEGAGDQLAATPPATREPENRRVTVEIR